MAIQPTSEFSLGTMSDNIRFFAHVCMGMMMHQIVLVSYAQVLYTACGMLAILRISLCDLPVAGVYFTEYFRECLRVERAVEEALQREREAIARIAAAEAAIANAEARIAAADAAIAAADARIAAARMEGELEAQEAGDAQEDENDAESDKKEPVKK